MGGLDWSVVFIFVFSMKPAYHEPKYLSKRNYAAQGIDKLRIDAVKYTYQSKRRLQKQSGGFYAQKV
jgi:hypothetical protein